jgi:hypothetical protein
MEGRPAREAERLTLSEGRDKVDPPREEPLARRVVKGDALRVAKKAIAAFKGIRAPFL